MSKRLKLVIVLLAVPAVAAGWWLGSPLFLDRSVDKAFPLPAPAAAETTPPSTAPAEEVGESTADDEIPDTEADPDEMVEPEGPIALAAGTFRDADDSHHGSGTATFYELDDGSRVLRFEDFEVTNGPDLRVILVPHGDPQAADDVEGYLELGPLKGNVGNQNYAIPADIDLGGYGSVVIYCKPFHVLFAVASLEG